MAEGTKVCLLTQEAYNKMKEELAHREGRLREIAAQDRRGACRATCPRTGGYPGFAREAQSKN